MILIMIKRVTKDTSQLIEEKMMKQEIFSISIQVLNKWIIGIIEINSRSIRVLEIKITIIDSIRCLKEDR